MTGRSVSIHETAEVSDQARVGEGTKVWHQAQIRENAKVGANCIIGKGVYIDFDVIIGDNVKIQNGASVYHGVTLEDGVFIGPGACLTNDKYPRAITPSGKLKQDEAWRVDPITVKYGASVGARAVILPGVVVGKFGMIGAGAVVTKDVPDHGLVQGNPARLVGFVCKCGRRLMERDREGDVAEVRCPVCEVDYTFAAPDVKEAERDSHIQALDR
jgi:acetyltransferase-like isoleucine patch superfamily enzyme